MRNSPCPSRMDLKNFLKFRIAHPGDEKEIGELLLSSFSEAQAKKTPSLKVNETRAQELREVGLRRRWGTTWVLELGRTLVGTFALIHPGAPITQAWTGGAANLRCLAVNPRFHGMGLSAMLLKKADEHATEWKVPGIALHVIREAEGVGKTYQRYGYDRKPEGDFENNGMSLKGYFRDLSALSLYLRGFQEHTA